MSDYDVVVIGAGSAGVWAAPFATRLGARVALIEKERIGGDCTLFGCVPSKAFLQAARVAWHLRTADRFGLDPVQHPVDLGRVMAGVQQAIARVYTFETPEALSRAGVDVVFGAARFEDAHTISIGGTDKQIRARHFLVCTGASPAVPAIAGVQDVPYWNYQSVWQQTTLPRRLLVVGGGPVALELSQAFTRFGSEVTIIARSERLLRMADPEASAVLRTVLEQEGVAFRFGARTERLETSQGTIRVVDRGENVEGGAVLVAVGRRAQVDGLGLKQAGVRYTERGIQVDRFLRTSQKHIYACGDVIGSFQFTHYAAWQASNAVRTMLFPGSSEGIRSHIPWTVFTDPEVAQCGLTEAEARQHSGSGSEVRVARWGLDRVDRAATDQDLGGFIKCVHRPDGEVLGAQVVTARAGEIIQEFALAIDRRIKLGELASSIHVYPTYATGVQQIAVEARLQAVAASSTLKWARKLSNLGRS